MRPNAKELDESAEKTRDNRKHLMTIKNNADKILGERRLFRDKDGLMRFIPCTKAPNGNPDVLLAMVIGNELEKHLKSGPVIQVDPKTLNHPDEGKIAKSVTYKAILIRRARKFPGCSFLRQLVRQWYRKPDQMSDKVVELFETILTRMESKYPDKGWRERAGRDSGRCHLSDVRLSPFQTILT